MTSLLHVLTPEAAEGFVYFQALRGSYTGVPMDWDAVIPLPDLTSAERFYMAFSPHVRLDRNDPGLAIARQANDIARRGRRGMGRHLWIGPHPVPWLDAVPKSGIEVEIKPHLGSHEAYLFYAPSSPFHHGHQAGFFIPGHGLIVSKDPDGRESCHFGTRFTWA